MVTEWVRNAYGNYGINYVKKCEFSTILNEWKHENLKKSPNSRAHRAPVSKQIQSIHKHSQSMHTEASEARQGITQLPFRGTKNTPIYPLRKYALSINKACSTKHSPNYPSEAWEAPHGITQLALRGTKKSPNYPWGNIHKAFTKHAAHSTHRTTPQKHSQSTHRTTPQRLQRPPRESPN